MYNVCSLRLPRGSLVLLGERHGVRFSMTIFIKKGFSLAAWCCTCHVVGGEQYSFVDSL